MSKIIILSIVKEEKIKRKTRQHPNEQSHILIEVDLLANIVDIRLWQAQEIIELLKPTVSSFTPCLNILSCGLCCVN